MNDFTVFDVNFPLEAKQRVIVNTDANNEADDQFAIVHAILTPSFDLHGIIPAHFGTRKSVHSGKYLPIRVYESVNTRFIHEDLFAKLAQFIRRGSRI